MKRFILTLALVLFLVPSLAWSVACTVTETVRVARNNDSMRITSVAWLSNSTTGAVTSTDCTNAITINGYLYKVVTDPGATAPTTLYDITLADSDAYDVMEGALADRSATVSEAESPTVGNVPMGTYVDGDVALEISAAGNAKIGTVIFYIYIE